MNKITAGVIAGLLATIVLSLLMVMKNMIGIMPDIDIIAMLAMKMGGDMAIGWMIHFMIGAIGYGLAFTFIFSQINFGNLIVRGMLLGTLGWLMMMLVLMPMMNAGVFGLNMPSGMMAPLATLMLHLTFGAVLGYVYCKLTQSEVRTNK